LQCGKTQVRAKGSFSPNFRTFILIDDMEPLWKLTCHGVLIGTLIVPEGTTGSFMY
jgi:hypothetical protein